MTREDLITALWAYKGGSKSITDMLTAIDAYSSASNDGKPLVSGSLPGWAAELLTEVRYRLLVDIDTDGEPRSSMAELLEMWNKVNKALDIKTIGK